MQRDCRKTFLITGTRLKGFPKLFSVLCQVLIFQFFLFSQAAAQQAHPDTTHRTAITLGLHGHYGFIIPHSSEIREIANSYPKGIEVDVSFHFTNEEAWQYLQGYPRIGASFSYFNFGNPEVLGNGYTLVAFAEPFLSAHKRFSLSFRLGIGIAYLDNVYDPKENPENLFYSSAISFPLAANFMANYRLNDSYLLRFGGTYTHISNAGIRQPNKGINYPTLTAGINYVLRPADFPDRAPSKGLVGRFDRHFLIAVSGGAKDSQLDESRKLPVIGLAAYLSQRIGRINGLLVGAEWVADFAIREHLQEKNDQTDFQRGALLLGHEFLIGRVRFNQQLGIYFYAPNPARDALYQRYGLEYQINDKLFLGINLKVHRHVADFGDFRLGWRF